MYGSNSRHPDDSSCSGCGVEMEVIGPPGPRHAAGCPSAPAPEPPPKWLGHGTLKCGCVVDGFNIMDPCFTKQCVLVRWGGFAR